MPKTAIPKLGGELELSDSIIKGRPRSPILNVSTLLRIVPAALPIAGTEVITARNYGMSLWARTAKICCRLPDGSRIDHFLKVKTSIGYFEGQTLTTRGVIS